MDGKFYKLLSLSSAQNSDTVLRRSENNVDSGTSGERRPLNTGGNDTSGGRVIPLDNGLDREFGIQSHVSVHSDDDGLDIVSLQLAQRERRNLGLLSSEGSDRHSVVTDDEQNGTSRFLNIQKSINQNCLGTC